MYLVDQSKTLCFEFRRRNFHMTSVDDQLSDCQGALHAESFLLSSAEMTELIVTELRSLIEPECGHLQETAPAGQRRCRRELLVALLPRTAEKWIDPIGLRRRP